MRPSSQPMPSAIRALVHGCVAGRDLRAIAAVCRTSDHGHTNPRRRAAGREAQRLRSFPCKSPPLTRVTRLAAVKFREQLAPNKSMMAQQASQMAPVQQA